MITELIDSWSPNDAEDSERDSNESMFFPVEIPNPKSNIRWIEFCKPPKRRFIDRNNNPTDRQKLRRKRFEIELENPKLDTEI